MVKDLWLSLQLVSTLTWWVQTRVIPSWTFEGFWVTAHVALDLDKGCWARSVPFQMLSTILEPGEEFEWKQWSSEVPLFSELCVEAAPQSFFKKWFHHDPCITGVRRSWTSAVRTPALTGATAGTCWTATSVCATSTLLESTVNWTSATFTFTCLCCSGRISSSCSPTWSYILKTTQRLNGGSTTNDTKSPYIDRCFNVRLYVKWYWS